jgi:phenylpropionate dioxygenase-like ring-hydroxylating dioxygenase large terminal subunit
MGDPGGPLAEFPIAEESGYRTVLAGPYRFRAQGPRVIENLLDVAHLGFVHAGLLGDPQRGEVEEYEVTAGTDNRGPEARQIRIWQPDPDGTGSAALVNYHYWVHGPLTAGFVKTHGQQRFGILAQVAPIDAETCESRLVMCLNYGNNVTDNELLQFQNRVTEQDRVIVESQRPELLPLDLQAELHLRSDRMAIAYRKWLRAIGLRYGTA